MLMPTTVGDVIFSSWQKMLMLEITVRTIPPVADEKTVLLQAVINAEWRI